MGTMDSSAFKSEPKPNDPSKTDTFFNGPGDGPAHGHVVESQNADGTPNYHYVRDVEGNVYVDDSKK